MNLITFPVSTTNIFPLANSTAGGQLLTEYNLRAIDSVATSEKVKYMIGPSYVHSEADFYVRLQSDSTLNFHNTVPISSTILEILPGRAIVNGHYVENLTPMTIDMVTDVNDVLRKDGKPVLVGHLSIGLKVMYSTEQTMAGTMDAKDSNGMYEGIQVVILPDSQFLLPEDVPEADQEAEVTAHIKLATFTYFNGSITNITNNYPAKCQVLPASRIGNIGNTLSGDFVQKRGLNPKRFYGMAGKGTNPETGYDTWCDITDSLMVWDNSIPQYIAEKPAIKTASFSTDTSGQVQLIIPHKQIDSSSVGYDMVSTNGKQQYFAPVVLDIPKADFNNGTPGTVDAEYTRHVKEVISSIAKLYNLPSGKQKAYIDVLNDRTELPPIATGWHVGDYVLVRQDYTVEQITSNGASQPSTLYMVVPGAVRSIEYDPKMLTNLKGAQLASVTMNAPPDLDNPDVVLTYWGDITQYRGTVGADYFKYIHHDSDRDSNVIYYFGVTSADRPMYSDPIMLTGGVPLAEEDVIGGFLNVPETATDYGYVYLDSDGHLRLLDYGLLRSGTAAYQLGEDFSTPSGVTLSEVQAYLNEYVNQRIAFPNINQTKNSDPNTIHINLHLSAEEDGGTIDIFDIDSRFNTSICIHIYGEADSNVTINISDCARVRIDPAISGTPTINLYRSSLYYDYTVLNYLNKIQDMSLWYEKYEETDPDLVVEGMTVRDVASESIYDTPNVSPIEYWSQDVPNDNHFTVALQSLTFDSNGYVSGCGVLVRNSSTANIQLGKSVINDSFEFSQGPALYYPKRRFLKPVKVTGSFVTAYTTEFPEGYIVQNTSFSLQSPCYDNSLEMVSNGNIAFLVDSYNVRSSGAAPIDVWDAGSFHHFDGTTLY